MKIGSKQSMVQAVTQEAIEIMKTAIKAVKEDETLLTMQGQYNRHRYWANQH